MTAAMIPPAITIRKIRYELHPLSDATMDAYGVPYDLLGEARWAVLACGSPASADAAGWITEDPVRSASRRRGLARTGRGRYCCWLGVSLEHLTGPPLSYLCNVRRPQRSGLAVVALAYAEWLTGADKMPRLR